MSIVRAALALLLSASAVMAAEVHFVPGTPAANALSGTASLKGALVTLSDNELTWRDEQSKSVVAPLSAILSIDLQPVVAFPNSQKHTAVELTDGSRLRCSRFAVKPKEVELTLAVSGLVVKVPLASVASILNDAQDPAIRQEWQSKHLARKRTQDFLALKLPDGSGIGGVEGTISGNDKGLIVFEYERSGVRTKREQAPARIQGMILFNSLGPQAPSALCQVQDVNENVLVASKVIADAKGFTIATVSGATMEYPRPAVARLDYGSDKLLYLSDLKPIEVIEKTRQGRKDNWRTDKNLENGPLHLEGQVYSKGLSLHSHTELLYALDGKYKEFKAQLGMDDLVGGDGRPVVKIEGDGKELFAGTVSRKDKRQEILLDVKGVKQLRIIVTSSGLFDFGDHVDFADAKLCK